MRTRVLGNALTITLTFLLGSGGCMDSKRSLNADNKGNISADKPHFEIEPEKLRLLRDKVESLKLGDSRAHVIERTGAFDREEFLGPKTGSDWKCRGLVYSVLQIHEMPGTSGDRRIELIFDREDRLVAVLSNVDGVPDRGDMRVCR